MSQHPQTTATPVVPAPRPTEAMRPDAGRARARLPREAAGARARGAPEPPAQQEREQELLLPYSAINGSASLDPLFNGRFLLHVLRQAGLFAAVYLFAETVAAVFFGLLAITGIGVLGALNLWIISASVISLALAALFWLLPVPALLAQWSLLVDHKAAAADTAFGRITEALQVHETPLDSVVVRALRPLGGGRREYLELREGRFAGFVSCFAHGRDLYVGLTFWLYLSPLRLLLMVIGRRIQDMRGRGNDIHQTLGYESTRATIAAVHGAVLEGIDVATGDLGLPGRMG